MSGETITVENSVLNELYCVQLLNGAIFNSLKMNGYTNDAAWRLTGIDDILYILCDTVETLLTSISMALNNY